MLVLVKAVINFNSWKCMQKFITVGIIGLLLIGVGVLIGWKILQPKTAVRQVDSQIILTALQERGFLVTKTLVSTVSATIKTDEVGFLKKLLWGQEVKASGVVEINLGVDLKNLSSDDIEISGNTVKVVMPQAEIFNSRLVGDVNVENKQGILKRFLENDDGYNQAMEELLNQAEKSLVSEGVLQSATDKAGEEIRRLVGYLAPENEIVLVVE